MKILNCDRCNGDNLVEFVAIGFIDDEWRFKGKRHWDLCIACRNTIHAWLKCQSDDEMFKKIEKMYKFEAQIELFGAGVITGCAAMAVGMLILIKLVKW